MPILSQNPAKTVFYSSSIISGRKLVFTYNSKSSPLLAKSWLHAWLRLQPEVESSRTSLASRTHFEVLGLVLGLEASSPRKLACPRLEDSSIFWIVKILWSAWKIFWKTFFRGDRLKNFCEDLFFFLESTCACVLGPWPWPRAFLSLASRVSVLGKAVLGLYGLGFFCVLGLGLEPCVLDSTSGCSNSVFCKVTRIWSQNR